MEPQPTRLFTLPIDKTKLNLSTLSVEKKWVKKGVSLDTSANISISRCFSRTLKVHEIAEIINVLTRDDNAVNYRISQLLGAFIQEPGKHIHFIGSNELRQCAIILDFIPLTAAKGN